MISIVTPTYNRGFCIVECLENVLEQTYQDFEIIVVDDCSSDDTAAKIATVADTRIRYIRNATNQGAASARNTGAAAAKGEYLAFQDSDDLWSPDKLRLQMEHLKETGSDMSFCQLSRGDIPYLGDDARHIIKMREPDLFVMILAIPLIGTPAILCKKSCFDALGGFDNSLHCFEDYEFSLRFAERYSISYYDTSLVTVRRLDDGVNSNQSEKFKINCLLFERYYPQIAEHQLIRRWISRLSFIGQQCPPELQIEEFTKIKLLLQSDPHTSKEYSAPSPLF